MPRHLPWKTNTSSTTTATSRKPAKSASKPSSPPPKRVRTPCSPTKYHDSDINSSDLESMHSSDDAWIMVEDEFQSTAQLLTRSIRHKEYARLRLEEKHASQISNIQRPVVASSSASKDTLQRRQRAAKARLHQKQRTPEDEGTDGEDVEEGGEQLGAMMRGLYRQGSTLMGLGVDKPGRAQTRAGAVFKGSWRPEEKKTEGYRARYEKPTATGQWRALEAETTEDEDEDDDDLGAPVVLPSSSTRTAPRPPPHTSNPTTIIAATASDHKPAVGKPSSSPNLSSRATSRPIIESSGPDFFSLDSIPGSTRFRRRSKQKTAVEVKTEEKKERGDFVKTLFSL